MSSPNRILTCMEQITLHCVAIGRHVAAIWFDLRGIWRALRGR